MFYVLCKINQKFLCILVFIFRIIPSRFFNCAFLLGDFFLDEFFEFCYNYIRVPILKSDIVSGVIIDKKVIYNR